MHRLERIRIQLQQSREHAIASREGVCTVFSVELKRSIQANYWPFFQLFNASSFIEARAASRLGENVKLLTYLNIIYLPIMCSVVSNTFLQTWTIPERIKAFFALTTDNYFDMHRLPWVTVLISAVTYLAMLNVDHIARVLSWRPLLPQRYKSSVLEKMSRDPDRMWRERGALLNANNAAAPAHADTSVSSWRIHEYFILNWWRERKERKRIEHRDRPPLNTDGGRRWQWARFLKPKVLTGWVKTPHITPARNGTGAHRREEEEILGNTEGMEMDEISITRPEPAHVRNTYQTDTTGLQQR